MQPPHLRGRGAPIRAAGLEEQVLGRVYYEGLIPSNPDERDNITREAAPAPPATGGSDLTACSANLNTGCVAQWVGRPTQARTLAIRCCAVEPAEDDSTPELTKVGSKAYYDGFFTQPVDASVTEERGDGTEQALKFAASSFGVIAVLLLGFLASNGLL